jgi:tetratricopeptide (TPR) repeat protein
MGKALRTFQRSLALDSNFTVAYQHILDALGNCAFDVSRLPSGQPGYVCLADSAIYGTHSELERRLGAATIARWQREADEALIPTAYAWAAVAPDAERARNRLILLLLEKERFTEAENQAQLLAGMSDPVSALAFKGAALYGQRRYAEAADSLLAAFELYRFDDGPFAYSPSANPLSWTAAALRAAGRDERARLVDDSLLSAGFRQAPAANRYFGSTGPLIPTPAFKEFLGAWLEMWTSPSPSAEDARRALRVLQQAAPRDTALLAHVMNSADWPSAFVHTAAATNDAALMNELLASLEPQAWGSLRALASLERGDSAGAWRAAQDFLRERRPPATGREVVELYTWGTVLARLGRLEDAARTYEGIDSARVWDASGGQRVRAWAERGALYQALGDANRAIDMYERVVDALKNADGTMQPFADRARQALAVLRGEATPERRR